MIAKRLLALLIGAACIAVPAWAQVKVGVITSSTGPIALVGIPHKNTVELLPKKIGDTSLQYIPLDDASDPTATVTSFKKLLSENVDLIIGPSGSPNAMGVIPLAAEAGVPVFATVGSAAVVLPMNSQKKWIFKTSQNDDVIAKALVDHMAAKGVKRLGFIGTADPFGENWQQVVAGLAKQHGITMVAAERFQRQDPSVTAQTIRLIGARPDAVLIAAPGSSSVMPQTTLFDQGFKGQIYQTHGAALPEFLKLGGRKVEGTILAASLMLVMDDIPDSNPSKKVALEYIQAYKQKYGVAPSTFGSAVYDAGLLLERALPKAVKTNKPGTPEFRKALRDALEETKELAGTQGIYNMTPEDHSGFDERGRELIVVKNGAWQLLK